MLTAFLQFFRKLVGVHRLERILLEKLSGIERRIDRLEQDSHELIESGRRNYFGVVDSIEKTQCDLSYALRRVDDVAKDLAIFGHQIRCMQNTNALMCLFPKLFHDIKPPAFMPDIYSRALLKKIGSGREFAEDAGFLMNTLQGVLSSLHWYSIDSKVYKNIIETYNNLAEREPGKWAWALALVEFAMIHGDPFENLETFFARIELRRDTWPPRLLKLYGSCLLMNGELELALEIAGEYVSCYGLTDVFDLPPFSFLVDELGKADDDVKKSARIYREIVSNQKIDLFRQYFCGKKVCVVGNAPYEVGSGNGGVIDKYDLVVRFNDYNLSVDYVVDYGSKTSVWVTYEGHFFDSGEKGKFDLFVLATNVYCEPMSMRMVNSLVAMLDAGIGLLNTGGKIRAEIATRFDIYAPSNGFVMLYWIKKYKSDFCARDCFGFSFTRASVPEVWERVTSPAVFVGHDLASEAAALNEIFWGVN